LVGRLPPLSADTPPEPATTTAAEEEFLRGVTLLEDGQLDKAQPHLQTAVDSGHPSNTPGLTPDVLNSREQGDSGVGRSDL
jgi:hypothetical protein